MGGETLSDLSDPELTRAQTALVRIPDDLAGEEEYTTSEVEPSEPADPDLVHTEEVGTKPGEGKSEPGQHGGGAGKKKKLRMSIIDVMEKAGVKVKKKPKPCGFETVSNFLLKMGKQTQQLFLTAIRKPGKARSSLGQEVPP